MNKNQKYIVWLLAVLLSLVLAVSAQAQVSLVNPAQSTAETRTVTYSNGDRYSGEFVNGKFNGTGQYFWAGGDSYSGQFTDGQINGYGKLTFASGYSWSGSFVNGQIVTGVGEYFVGSNGDMFSGNWIDGLPNGTGTLIRSNGTKEQVSYQNGQLVVIGSSASSSYPLSPVSPSSGSSYAENPFHGLSVGSTVYFGRYEQDNNYNNGSEAILWRVIDIQNGRALLLSVYGLETMAYHYQSQPITWENCSLRAYLNSNFLNGAFSAQERQFIAQSYIANNSSSAYGTYGGNATYDYIFLLSIDEIRYYFPSEGARKMQPTNLARAHGAYGTADVNCAWWWLRSPGQATNCASSINSIGVLLNTGPVVSDTTGAIRPAMWVIL